MVMYCKIGVIHFVHYKGTYSHFFFLGGGWSCTLIYSLHFKRRTCITVSRRVMYLKYSVHYMRRALTTDGEGVMYLNFAQYKITYHSWILWAAWLLWSSRRSGPLYWKRTDLPPRRQRRCSTAYQTFWREKKNNTHIATYTNTSVKTIGKEKVINDE